MATSIFRPILSVRLPGRPPLIMSAVNRKTLELPTIAGEPHWQGLRPTAYLAAPEPMDPQGVYAAPPAHQSLALPVPMLPALPRNVELLAPAGGLDAAFAAFHFGADAVYLGLKKF